MKPKYNTEESEILKHYKNNELNVTDTNKVDIEKAVEYAKNTVQKNTVLSIQLTEKDFKKLKAKEIETGISYDNLISALIHKFVENKIEITF